jgi:hypothetical protein
LCCGCAVGDDEPLKDKWDAHFVIVLPILAIVHVQLRECGFEQEVIKPGVSAGTLWFLGCIFRIRVGKVGEAREYETTWRWKVRMALSIDLVVEGAIHSPEINQSRVGYRSDQLIALMLKHSRLTRPIV